MTVRLTLADVEQARAALAPHLAPTPLRPSLAAPGAGLYLKLECWQPTGSFKVRGAIHVLSSLTGEERQRGVVAASAGNHALGVAFAAERLAGTIPATLFLPRTAPLTKLQKLARFPVEIRQVGDSYDDTVDAAHDFERRTGAVFVHAYEDTRTAAGQGTVALEILEQCPDLGTVLVPVGGGGLLAGVATVLAALAPRVRVIAVQPDASPALRESVRLGTALLTYPARPTLADGLAGGVGQIALDHMDLVDEIVEVSEREIEDAIVAILAADQVVVEASGAVGVAALRSGRLRDAARGPIVAILTGGNIDATVLARLLATRLDEARS